VPSGTGLDSQFGLSANEATYGTPAAIDRFYEYVDESLSLEIEKIASEGKRPGAGGKLIRAGRRVLGRRTAGGDVSFEVMNKSMGRLFESMFGTSPTPTVPSGGTLARDFVFTLGDLPGKAKTLQIGRPEVGGTVRPFTYHGAMVNEWELNCAEGELAKLETTWVAEDEDTTTALAAATYPTGLSPLTYIGGSVTIGGSALDVREASVTCSNNLKDDRRYWGSRLIREPKEVALREFGGTLQTDFFGLTEYNRFLNGDTAELIIKLEGDTIEGALKYMVEFTLQVQYDGNTPSSDGFDVVQHEIPFVVVTPDTGPNQLRYRTVDTAL